MRLESNVRMENGYRKAHDYAQHSKFNAGFNKLVLDSRSAKGLRWFDIIKINK